MNVTFKHVGKAEEEHDRVSEKEDFDEHDVIASE